MGDRGVLGAARDGRGFRRTPPPSPSTCRTPPPSPSVRPAPCRPAPARAWLITWRRRTRLFHDMFGRLASAAIRLAALKASLLLEASLYESLGVSL